MNLLNSLLRLQLKTLALKLLQLTSINFNLDKIKQQKS